MRPTRARHLLRRLALVLALGLLAGAAAGASSASALVVGLGDQKTDFFSSVLFHKLEIDHLRYVVPWDWERVPWEEAQVEQWLGDAQAAHDDVLVEFGDSSVPERHRVLPSARRFRRMFRDFHRRFPFVHEFSTWNEANHCSQATCAHPGATAHLYDQMVRVCPGCRLVAASVLDEPGMLRWVRRFEQRARKPIRIWGEHSYLDVNYLDTFRTRRFLRHVKGCAVWMTETGGIVDRHNHSPIHFVQSARHAAKATHFLFHDIAPLSPRIRRIYLYEWNQITAHDTWDTALVNRFGDPRPAYWIVRHQARRALRLRRLARARRLNAGQR